MNNLVDSGLDLRTIEVRQLHQIVADLNYNFKQMLHLPGFKGQIGADGLSITGSTGQRGNMWIFADSTRFITVYSAITSSGQVTMPFINGQVTSSLATLLTTLQISELVHNDIIVLPSRDVIQFNSTTNQFIETGIRFADGLSLTESEVISIVNNILGGLTNNDVYTTYKGIVKNYADNGAGLNTEENYNSILDIPTSGAGIGVESSVFQFTSLKEAVTTTTMQNMLITGSPSLYHKLAQDTMNNKTVDFMAGVDDFGALAVMQNSYKNGILLGHKDATDFSSWGRIYRTEQKLRFLSDYHPTLDKSARLDLGKSGTELYSPKDLKILIKSGFVAIEDYSTGKQWLRGTTDYLTLGYATLPYVKIENSEYVRIHSQIGANTQLLGLYDNKLKASTYQPKSDVIVNDATKLVTHNLFYAFQVNIQSQIDAIIIRLNDLEAQKVYRQQTLHTASVNANNITSFGLHIIKRNSTATYTNFPNDFVSSGLSNDAYVKVNRFEEGSSIWIEQEYVHKGAGIDTTISAKRRGVSTNTGGIYTWSEWTYLLDSDNFQFKSGTKISNSSVKFNDGFEITVNHALHSTTSIVSQPATEDAHKVLKGLSLDSTGHPINGVVQNLDEWYYTKPEIDDLLRSHIPIGAIILWSGSPSNIPDGYLLCNGQATTPNLSGRFVVGYDASNTQYSNVGALGGGNTATLSVANLPPHSHTGNTNSNGSHTHGYKLHRAESRGESKDDGYWRVGDLKSSTTDAAGNHSHSFTTNNTGSGTPFDARPPYYVICYIQFVGFGTPSITSPTVDYTGTVGISMSIQPTAIGTVNSWSATGLPLGLGINPITGEITGVPSTPTTTTVTLIATNSQGGSTPFTFVININPSSGSAPIITSDTNLSAIVGSFFTYTITASGSPTSFGAVDLPSYLTLNTTTGVISGFVPLGTTNLLSQITLSATNASGSGSTIAWYGVQVAGGGGGLGSPNLLILGNRTVYAGTPVTYPHTNVGGASTNWTISGLPLGLQMDSSSGIVTTTGSFGVPLSQVGQIFNVTVSATNSAGTSTGNYKIKVLA